MPLKRPEHQLLLQAARPTINSVTVQEQARPNLDWHYLFTVATWNRVTPLLQWNLNQINPELIPASIRDDLRPQLQFHTQRNLFLAGETLRLLKRFGNQGISVMPLKGAVLAELFYGDLTMREYTDIDLLVHEADVQQAVDLLHELGYERGGLQEATCESCLKHYQFQHTRHHTSVELHWSVVEEHLSGLAESTLLWDHAETMQYRDTPILLPQPEDLLIYLCHHGAAHGWIRLSWVADVAAVISQVPDLDWKRIMTTTEGLHSGLIVRLGLKMVHDLMESPLPPEVLQWIAADASAQRIAETAIRHIFAGEAGQGWAIEGRLLQFRLRERWRDRYHYVRCVICGNLKPGRADKELVNLPRPLHFLYYIMRPFRLMGTYLFPWLKPK